jgi:pentatricopeptide repeat domain (PPR motif)
MYGTLPHRLIQRTATNAKRRRNITNNRASCCKCGGAIVGSSANYTFTSINSPIKAWPRKFNLDGRDFSYYSCFSHGDSVIQAPRIWYNFQNNFFLADNQVVAKYHGGAMQKTQNSENKHGEAISSIVVSTKKSVHDVRLLDKTTQRLLEAPIGTLNPAATLEFTTSIYSWHAQAITNPSNVQAFEKSKQLFYRMMHEAQVNPCITVDIETMNRGLDTWRILSVTQAPTKFEKSTSTGPSPNAIVWEGYQMLQKIKEFSNECERIEHPNDKSFNMIMDSYAKFGMANEAHALLEEMNLLAREGLPQCRPDTITYNTLLSAHGNAISLYQNGRTKHAEKAMDILENMLQVYNDTGSIDTKPDVISYSTVIAACANAATSSPTFAQMAEDILNQMKEMYNSSLVENGGNGEWLGLRPNHVCYSSVIHAWSNSGVADAARRASLLFAEMQSQGDADISSMTALLGTYGNAQDGNGFQQAESMLNQMIEVAQESGNMASMPNTITFTALIDCLAQSLGRSLESDGGVLAKRQKRFLDRWRICTIEELTV